jgi:hypothetical protein
VPGARHERHGTGPPGNAAGGHVPRSRVAGRRCGDGWRGTSRSAPHGMEAGPCGL